MTHIQIHAVEVEAILRTQQPREKYEALVCLFNSNFEGSIDSPVAVGSSGGEPETFSDNSEKLSSSDEPIALSASDISEKLSSSDEFAILGGNDSSKKLDSSDEFEILSDSNESDDLSFRNKTETSSVNENHVKYTFYNEKGEKCTLSFVGGSLLKVKSNKGNDRIICVAENEFSSGCEKKVYYVNWQVSIKADGCNFYKHAPNYVWASFLLIQKQSGAKVSKEIDKASEEVGLYKLFHHKTKQLCEIKFPLPQYGFMMPNLGIDLINVVMAGDYSEDDRAEIALLLIEEFKYIFKTYEKVHCDLKLDNVCYNHKEKKVNFIDLDGITSIYDLFKVRPTVTPEYLSQFLFDEEKEYNNTALLCLGQYRIIHSLWTLVATCARLIYGQQEIEDEYFLDKLKQIDGYFKNLQTDSRSLTQEEIITETKKLALEFIISFDSELCREFNIVPPFPQNSLIPLSSSLISNDKEDIEDKSRKRKRAEVFQFWSPNNNGGNDSGVRAVKRKRGGIILDAVSDPVSNSVFTGAPTTTSRSGRG